MEKRSRNAHPFIRLWLPLVAWLSFIFFMSTGTFSAENTYSVLEPVLHFLFPHLSLDRIAAIHGIIRKGAHVFEYFVLGLLLLRALCALSGGVWKWRWALLALVGVALWALGDEFHQSFVPTRTASIVDVGIDTVGGALAQFVAALWYMMKSVTPRRYERKRA